MKKFFAQHPLISILLLTFFGAVIGAIIGRIYAVREVLAIAEGVRQTNPNDPLDNLWIIGFGIMFIGLIVGLVGGLVTGILTCLIARRRATL